VAITVAGSVGGSWLGYVLYVMADKDYSRLGKLGTAFAALGAIAGGVLLVALVWSLASAAIGRVKQMNEQPIKTDTKDPGPRQP
jgi:hypothetical protein